MPVQELLGGAAAPLTRGSVAEDALTSFRHVEALEVALVHLRSSDTGRLSVIGRGDGILADGIFRACRHRVIGRGDGILERT